MADYAIHYDYIVNEVCIEKDSLENLCMGKCYLSEKVLKQLQTDQEEKPIVQISFIKIPHILKSGIINLQESKSLRV